jgi:hypothetical protein
MLVFLNGRATVLRVDCGKREARLAPYTTTTRKGVIQVIETGVLSYG